MLNWKNFDELESYKALKSVKPVELKEVMAGESGAKRVKEMSVPMAAGFSYNYAAKAVDEDILKALVKLADDNNGISFNSPVLPPSANNLICIADLKYDLVASIAAHC